MDKKWFVKLSLILDYMI